MKGDVSTLRKICRYASSVMLAGTFVLGAVLACTLALGAAAAAGIGWASDALSSWMGIGMSSAAGTAAFAELAMILVLATVTVFSVYRVMRSMHTDHSPFNDRNVDSMRMLSKAYLAFAVLLAITEWFAHGSVVGVLFLFFGPVMVGVVVYCLALAFRYGGILQKESDETLRGGNDDNTQAGQGHGGPEDVPQPARGEGRHIQREPVQHQDREDLRHTLLYAKRDLQGPRLPAGGHIGVRRGRRGFTTPTTAPSPSSSSRTGRSP